jgi:pimeloyl-ACP methyl ester carboxylesterase
MRGPVRDIRFVLLLSIIISTIFGAVYESISRSRTANEFPVIGKLVDIGGRRIQLDCRGVGRPTVVFESGLDLNGSLSWSGVHELIAKTTRACAYSRAGIMWSDPSGGTHNGRAIAEDLHLTLLKAGEKAPYVLVGHSMGGPYIMIYTKYFGSEVAGLVFVDASHPDQVERLKAITPLTEPVWLRLIAKTGAALAWTGMTRGIILPLFEKSAREYWRLHKWPSDAVLAYGPTSLDAIMKETDAFEESLAEAGTARQLNDRPVFVLTGMEPLSAEVLGYFKLTPEQGMQYQEILKSMQGEEASWSTQSQHQVVSDAGHYIQFDQPDVVISAVLSVVNRVRAAVNRDSSMFMNFWLGSPSDR